MPTLQTVLNVPEIEKTFFLDTIILDRLLPLDRNYVHPLGGARAGRVLFTTDCKTMTMRRLR